MFYIGKKRVLALIPAALFCCGSAADQGNSFHVGRISSEQSCTTYTLSSGNSAAIVTLQYGVALATWRSWLQRDCTDNFSSIRASLEAALASSPSVARAGGGVYTISGTIAEAASRVDGISGDGFDTQSSQPGVLMNVLVKDSSGKIVFGVTVVKHIASSYSISASQLSAYGSVDSRLVYTDLQAAIAKTVARSVILHFSPIKVISSDSTHVLVDYGTPLLDVGTMLQVIGNDGKPYRFTVSSSTYSDARAESDGGSSQILVGSIATLIEPESSAANARRYDKVDLP